MSDRAEAVAVPGDVQWQPRKRAPITRVLAVSLALAAVCVTAAPAHAQDDEDEDVMAEPHPLRADFKGAIGLGLIGAELGFVVPALAGAKGVWPYIVFPVLGAGGGAVGGYFLLEKGDGHPELAVGVLTLGMALVVPAMVATIAATSYRPPEQIQTASMARRRAIAQSGDGLVRWSGEELALAAPNVTVTTAESPRVALRTGAPRRTSGVRVSLLSGRF
ncbi:MAG TPA: hypothetical protein VK509_00745 [Polyangiales bacterium]|nr:hypothetical protein [Polyangiales bacterium]